VDETTLSNGADISWNGFTDIDQSQFVDYLIKLKKRDTEESIETPYTFSTTDTFYSITNMVTLMDYEVFVSVNTIDFGQSEWSEALYFTTTDMSYSELAEMDNLINTVTNIYEYYNTTIDTIYLDITDTVSDLNSRLAAVQTIIDSCVVVDESSIATDITILEARLTAEECDGSVWFDAYRYNNFLNGGTVDYEYIRPSTISAMNISAGIFTAPKDGTYSVQFNARSNAEQTTITIVKNSNEYLASSYDGDNGNKRNFMTQTIVDLAVGDTVHVESDQKINGAYAMSIHFTGELLTCPVELSMSGRATNV